MNRTATIDYHGVPMTCEFNHVRGYNGNRIDPPEPELAEFTSIKVGCVDVYSIFTEDQLSEIEALCLEWCSEDDEYQRCEHADRQREERALGHA